MLLFPSKTGARPLLFFLFDRDKETCNGVHHDIRRAPQRRHLLKNYCEQKVIEKMKKQMINVDNFFTTLIESIKFIRKIRCFNEFTKIDKNNVGWINIKQLNTFFNENKKKYNIKTKLNPNDKIEFETFYRIFNEYNGFKN